MAEVDLPVWTIRPNWKDGILERLEWLTDVLASDSGTEQRRSVRLSPRRSFEITVNPTHQARTYLDLVMHRLGGGEWMVPLWHDQAQLSAAAIVGANRIAFDNNYREFLPGGYALIYYDTFTWEVVAIDAQDANGLDLAVPLDNAWPLRSLVFPLRRMTLPTDTDLSALTGTVGQAQLLWTINEPNDYDPVMPATPLYLGRPVVNVAPDRKQEITASQTRLIDEQDGEIGLRYRVDSADRAFQAQAHNWQITGREAQARFRSMLYWLRGRQRMAWLPSFNDDVILSQPLTTMQDNVKIRKVGIGYVAAGGTIPGRDRFWTGSEVVRWTGVEASPGPDQERLAISAPVGQGYLPGASWSFLDAVRLDTDTIELHHNATSDGTLECGATWKSFRNSRTTPDPIYLPIATAGMGTSACGSPGVDPNPCRQVDCPNYPVVLVMTTLDGPEPPCNTGYDPYWSFGIPPLYCTWDPTIGQFVEYHGYGSGGSQANPPLYENGPGGVGINPNQLDSNGRIYERDDFVNPESGHYQEPGYERFIGQLLVEGHRVRSEGQWTFHFPVAGNFYGSLQYPAFYCGTVGRDSGGFKLKMCRTGGVNGQCACPMDTVFEMLVQGNVPYLDLAWSF